MYIHTQNEKLNKMEVPELQISTDHPGFLILRLPIAVINKGEQVFQI